VGGPLDITYLEINVGTGGVRLVPGDVHASPGVPETFPFELEPGQTKSLVFITTSGREGQWRWRVQLEAVNNDGKPFNIPIDNDGQPFELVTGRNPLNQHWKYTGTSWELVQ
jgi:hypothetical protein